jgi:putative ABC transport system permease protein
MKQDHTTGPPRRLYAALRFFIRRDMKLFVLGDFEEEYHEIAEARGQKAADRWFRIHLFRSLPRIVTDTAVWRMEMLSNYLVVALRNIKRQKVFSLINVLGLSLALTVFVWIFLFIKDEFSFDRFHTNRDSIYSIVKTDHHFENMRRKIYAIAGPAVKEYFPGVKHSVRFTHADAIVRHEDKLFQEGCDFADADFFRMFSFRLLRGDAEHVLEKESGVVLTRSLAEKYFGTQDPMGETLTVSLGQEQKDFVVSGVAEDVPDNSSIRFEMIMNMDVLTRLYGPPEWDNWEDWTLVNTFVRLDDGVSPDVIEDRMPAFLEQYYGPYIEDRKSRGSWNEDGPTLTLWLQSLKDIHLHSRGIEGSEVNRLNVSYLLAGIGLLILLIACINFTNLSIGRASTRTVEIGMRKILGAQRKNLTRQFWSESVLLVFIAMCLALAAGTVMLPLFNRLSGKNFLESHVLNVSNLGLMAVCAVLLGVIAGLYPGAVLSRIQPVTIFRGGMKLGGKNLLIRMLIVAQFTASIILVISTLTLSRQVKYIFSKDLGYERGGVVVIRTLERRSFDINAQIFNVMESEAANLPHILNVSGCVFPLSSEIGSLKLTYNDRRLDCNFTSVHYNFFDTMGIRFLAGGDFPRPFPSDSDPVIVTESFVKAYGIEEPVGTSIFEGTTIVGVVEDIHFWNLKRKIMPTVIVFDQRGGPRNLLVRVDTSDMSRAVSSLERIWKKAQPDKPFVYTFEDTLFQEKYAEEKRWSGIVFFSSFFALLISCMGLVGITTLAIGRRIKEVGIRRVLGASVLRISSLLTWEFLILVAAGNLIAWPLGYYFMRRWLEGYAYRATIDLSIFLLAGFLTLIISVATIGILVYRAASANPVKSLRYE